jgi:HSP20 family molecular chaperone IbpA
MNTLTRRRTNPLTELLGWLDSEQGVSLAPAIRVEDFVEDDTYVLRADLPGIDPENDVDISLEGDVLTISGERREEIKERHRREVHYGSFVRTVQLPGSPGEGDVTASYADGVLEVRVPRAAAVAEARRIPVQRAGS